MVSVLRTLQAEWNSLVPAAQAMRIPRVRPLNAPLETIAYRRAKLDWLRSVVGVQTNFDNLTFGVELEFIMPVGFTRMQVARLINNAGVPCTDEAYNHTTRSSWKVVTDGSLGDYERGAELVSPVLTGEAGFDQLRKVCSVLTAARCTVRKSCGLHVHVGASSELVQWFKNLVTLYAAAEPTIDSFLSPSRRGSLNQYCKSLKDRTSHALLESASTINAVASAVRQNNDRITARSSNRYCKLNLQSFWQHGTVEFRHHQGTVESQKAENWVRFVLRMCVAARKGTKSPTTFDQLMDDVEATDVEKNYFRGRVEYFARSVSP